ncbi:HEAT repeat domain-containing protein [Thalassoroseus pseudoceratinae]|uniref:HEAT repeat domain-containing protein n=1 Tax=Thalassoroseus pseudoceratinae TaxID=2713176 RepID=UPI001420D798|nr:HEAT repeat domain-containing protein [Thalassoroseus pseudoceratinae]
MIRMLVALCLWIGFGFSPVITNAAEPYAPTPQSVVQSKAKLAKTLEAHPEILLTLVEMAAQLDEPSVAQKANVEQVGYSNATDYRAARPERANHAILAMGTAAVPGLVELLDDKRLAVRRIAVTQLAYAARHPEFPAETVLPALTRVAREEQNQELRLEAQIALTIAVQLMSHPGLRETISKEFNDQLNDLE